MRTLIIRHEEFRQRRTRYELGMWGTTVGNGRDRSALKRKGTLASVPYKINVR